MLGRPSHAGMPGWDGALAHFTPFESLITKFDAEVTAKVVEDRTGCVSIAICVGNKVYYRGYA